MDREDSAISSSTRRPADLTGQVALVTGGGRGIGRVFAQALAAAGATVAVAARSGDEVAHTVALIEAAGGQAMGVPLDVTHQLAVEQAVETIRRRCGSVDLLVNNAGVWGPLAPIAEVDPDAWWGAMEINLRGTFICTRAVLPGMIDRRLGRIINISSHAGIHRWPGVSAYAISKAALIKLTEHVAAETKRQGIAAFAVHPGLVTVGLTEAALALAAPPESSAGRAAAWVRQEVEAGHAVPPERGAHLVVRLASGLADALSGRYLTVDDDLDALVARAAEIQRDDLYTLRLHTAP